MLLKDVSCLVLLSMFMSTWLPGSSVLRAETVQELLDRGYVELEEARPPMSFGDAHDYFFAALEQAMAAGDRRGEAAARLALGRLRVEAEEGIGALAYFELARDIYRSLGEPGGEAEAEYGVGQAFVVLGMLEEAQAVIERALTLDSSDAGRAVAIAADIRSVLARTHTEKGAYDEAIRHLSLAFEDLTQVDEPRRLREVGLQLGDLYHRVGRFEEALEILELSAGALDSEGATVDAEAIRLLFQEFSEASSKRGDWLGMGRGDDPDASDEELRERATQQQDSMEEYAEWFSAYSSEAGPPTLARDPAFAARRQQVSRSLPFRLDPSTESVITPKIRWRVVTSYRIFEPLVRDCGQLHETYAEQVTAVKKRLREEIPGLARHQECKSWLENYGKMTREERQAGAAEHSDCFDTGSIARWHVSFWDLEPEWPGDCGEYRADTFDPQGVGPVEEDLQAEELRKAQQSMEERFPELKTHSIEEVIAMKKEEAGSIDLSLKGNFFKSLKNSVVDKVQAQFDLVILESHKMFLDLLEHGRNSNFAEKSAYQRIAGGFSFLRWIDDLHDKHADTLRGMCSLAFEAGLRDSLSRTLSVMGPDFSAAAESAVARSWQAQQTLWTGMGNMGIQADSFESLRETLTPSLVFESCTERVGVLLNFRRIALWRGQVSLENGDLPMAAALFNGAWKGRWQMPQRHDPELEIEALIGLGETYEKQGLPALAAIYYQEAIGLVESIQGTLRQESMTMSFADAQTALYGRMVDLLVDMGEEELTFEYAGRARARAFLDLIGNERLDLRGVAPELSAEWNATRAELAKVQGQERELDPFASVGSERRELARQQAQLEVRLEELQDTVRRRHPSAATWVSIEPPPLENLVEVAAEEGTSIVVYFLSPRRLLAWVIERGEAQQLILEVERSEIEAQVEAVRRQISTRQTPTELLEQLYSTLIAPVVPRLAHKKLILVPYGVLHQLPFAALRDPATGRYLVEDYRLTLLPSESVVTYVQERRNPWHQQALVAGNPDGSLPRAEQEAKDVAAFYGGNPVVGQAADERAVRQAAGQVDVLHLAAHGRFQQERALFGYVALAEGSTGEPTNDGRLEVFEVMNEVDLSGTNLVVLSACNSGVGQRHRGDDIVSMPRAMLYAGTPAVVSTLWSIDDTASQLLMSRFHGYLQNEALGAADALRAAQIELLRERATAAPYFWAGFTLSGDHAGRGAPPQRGPGRSNPWTYDPSAQLPPAPPPITARLPATLPWSSLPASESATQLVAEGTALLEERWWLGGPLAYPKLLSALETARSLEDRSAEAAARVGLGRLRSSAGDIAGGLAHLEMAETIYLDLEDIEGMATAQAGLAAAWRAWGALPRSRQAYKDTLELRAALELDPSGFDARAYESLAEVLELNGAYGSALHHLQQARKIWLDLGRSDRAAQVGVDAGELVASMNREDRSVQILQQVSQELEANPPPPMDPAAVAEVLADLAELSRQQADSMASWLAHAWSEDPFVDWPDPPTVTDEAFARRRQENLRRLPDLLADLGEAPRVVAPIHRQFSLSPTVYMGLIRDCAHAHRNYEGASQQLEVEDGVTFQSLWPAECGPGKKRFDPRHVWHTDPGIAPDDQDRRRGLEAWRAEGQRLSAESGPRAENVAAVARGRVESTLAGLGSEESRWAWAMGFLDEDPSLLLTDKSIVYHLLGATFAPIPEPILEDPQRYLATIDTLCSHDLAVRASNALWRSYSRMGEGYASEGERAREAAWQAATLLWGAWAQLGWVESDWQMVRDRGLPAPTLGACRGDRRGFIEPHDSLLWRGHSSLAVGQLARAKLWFSQAAGSLQDWQKPSPGIKISALLGLAEAHDEEQMPTLATVRFREAIAVAESVAEGLRRSELVSRAVDVPALYEQLNERLDAMGERVVHFAADPRDGRCPDWLTATVPLPDQTSPELVAQREALCLDLVAAQNRETTLRALPFTIGGYQGPGNNLARLLSQRIWLQNAVHALDQELRKSPDEHLAASVEGQAEAQVDDNGGYTGVAEGFSPLGGVWRGDSSAGGWFGSNIMDKFRQHVLGKVKEKAHVLLKGGKRWLRQKMRGKKATSTEHLPKPEEILGVTLYEKPDYGGGFESFGDSDPELKNNPLGHDYASSVQVDPGCIVTLYSERDFGGRSTVLRADTPNLKGSSVGEDEVSSLSVSCR